MWAPRSRSARRLEPVRPEGVSSYLLLLPWHISNFLGHLKHALGASVVRQRRRHAVVSVLVQSCRKGVQPSGCASLRFWGRPQERLIRGPLCQSKKESEAVAGPEARRGGKAEGVGGGEKWSTHGGWRGSSGRAR
ncbi:unnamed protein product [Protopolystoma xenopodis]|uniref:Uncharacterized protein n=1 Tax=Protopolystoma xenopodis TaxID=117903 RepID=A0A3S5CVR7_9PLAT|nr:unnamed protein product [Protopolystoma xenopodis]